MLKRIKSILVVILTLALVLSFAGFALAKPDGNKGNSGINKKVVSSEKSDKDKKGDKEKKNKKAVFVIEGIEEGVEKDVEDEELEGEKEEKVKEKGPGYDKTQEKLEHKARIRTKQALKAVTQYLKHYPDSDVAQQMLEEIINGGVKDQEGIVENEEELEEQEDTATKAFGRLGQLYKKMNRYREAIAVVEEGVSLNPEETGLYKQLGELYREGGVKGFKVFVNGKRQVFDQPPIIKEGRILVPVRAVTASLGADVDYDRENKTVTVVKDDILVKLELGSLQATINGEPYELMVPAKSINARTVVPLRFIAEFLGTKVDYDHNWEIIIINDRDKDVEIEIEEDVENQEQEEGESEEDTEEQVDEIIVEVEE